MNGITITTEAAKDIILSDTSTFKTRKYILEELLKGSSEYNDYDAGVVIMVTNVNGCKINIKVKNIKFFPETFQVVARLDNDNDDYATLNVLNPVHGWLLHSD